MSGKLLILTVILLLTSKLHAQKSTVLQLGYWGGSDYLCVSDQWETVYYVGGQYEVTVTLLPNGQRLAEVPYTGISDWEWPEGLVLKTAKSAAGIAPFRYSDALRDQLQLEYFVTRNQARDDSLWRERGMSPPVLRTAPEYHIMFEVPAELAGAYLCITAEWRHPQYGKLEAATPICARIVQPCSEAAQHVVWRTHVIEAYDHGNDEGAVALADSFVALGWHDIFGLTWARSAAMASGRFDDALRFLEICFERNHTVDYPVEGWEPLAAPTPDSRAGYLRQRERVIELKNRQQQR